MIKENKGGGDDEDDDSNEVNTTGITGTTTHHLCDGIVCDILTRLPVKSLMRFKSVCKHWQYMIQNDSLLIDLHFTRCKQRPSHATNLLIRTKRSLESKEDELTSVDDLALYEHQYQAPVVAARHRYKISGQWLMMKPVNGLICFYKLHQGYIRIANITTGQETPWIKLMLEDHEHVIFSYVNTGFGFDPATKQHKVVCIYKKSHVPYKPIYNDIRDEVEVCEVMTLEGNNNYTWRRLDVYPQYHLLNCADGTYVNGSIYWISDGYRCTSYWKRKYPDFEEPPLPLNPYHEGAALVAFDVGKEEFRTIEIPQYIVLSPEAGFPFFLRTKKLLEVSGHVALDDTAHANNKLWVFIDYYHHGCGKQEKCSSSCINGGGKWIGETISIDLNSFHNNMDRSIQWTDYRIEDSIHRTDEVVLMICRGPNKGQDPRDRFHICFYNWKTKTVRNRVEISTNEINTFYCLEGISTFTESILPV